MNDEDFKNNLTPEQYHVLREKGTEVPFSGQYVHHDEEGEYVCAACGNILFASGSKFNAHCGWPSFDRNMGEGTVRFEEDRSLGMLRTEVLCAKCDSHLGHLFDDGPTERGERYCINSVALDFKVKGEVVADRQSHPNPPLKKGRE